jgi:excisionase family DNA binding protein
MQTETQHEDEFLPIGKAASSLGVSVATLRRWEDAGHIESTRTIGGQRRFARSEIERVKREGATA